MNMPKTLNVNVNTTAYVPLNVTDPENHPFNLTLDVVLDSGRVTRNESYLAVQIYGRNAFDFRLTASDNMGATSLYNPELHVCDCVKGTCNFTDLTPVQGVGNPGEYYRRRGRKFRRDCAPRSSSVNPGALDHFEFLSDMYDIRCM